jgi:hypothetical protein
MIQYSLVGIIYDSIHPAEFVDIQCCKVYDIALVSREKMLVNVKFLDELFRIRWFRGFCYCLKLEKLAVVDKKFVEKRILRDKVGIDVLTLETLDWLLKIIV